MIVIIPIGGTGERFKNNGYKLPKALINVFGKPILYYLIDSINMQKIDFIYIPYNSEYSNYNFESKLKKDYPNIEFKFYELRRNTRGAAETINIALKNIKIDDTPALCLDCDNFYLTDIVSKWNGKNSVICVNEKNKAPVYSYIQVDQNRIIDIQEKNPISDKICTGAYGFSSIKELYNYTKYVIDNDIKQKSEFYMSTVIKEMMNNCEFTYEYDIHHNYAALEHHFGQNVIIHRKGATSAKEGQLGIIPGSQGTSSYIVRGKGNSDSFKSCSHGAGRRMSRNKAKETLTLQEEIDKMNKQGIIHSIRGKNQLDEAPSAYKDIDVVMEEQQDLVDIIVKLQPLAVIKG